MRIRTIPFHPIIFLLLSCLAMPAIACPPPLCGDCETWNPETEVCDWDCSPGKCCEDDGCVSTCPGCKNCVSNHCEDDDDECSTCKECVDGDCVLKATSECDVDSDCDPGQHCENCQCCTELGGACEQDAQCCSGICGPIGCGNCKSDSDCAECEVCFNGFCVSILPCPLYTHCDNHACVPDCEIDYLTMCTYTEPPLDPGCDHPVNSFACINPGGTCSWELVEGPDWQTHCVVPDCTRLPTFCVKLRPWLCYNAVCWTPLPTICCECDDSDVGTEVAVGSRDRCP